MLTSRRGFLTGLTAAFAAPAIVPYANLMPIKIIRPDPVLLMHHGINLVYSVNRDAIEFELYGQKLPFAVEWREFYEKMDPQWEQWLNANKQPLC